MQRIVSGDAAGNEDVSAMGPVANGAESGFSDQCCRNWSADLGPVNNAVGSGVQDL